MLMFARPPMAQWAGQFTGLTHATKLDDAEATLRSAVGLFAWCPQGERPRREKAIRKMAARVLRARLHFLKVQLRTLPMGTCEVRMDRLRAARAAAEAGGVAAILTEFGLVTRRPGAA